MVWTVSVSHPGEGGEQPAAAMTIESEGTGRDGGGCSACELGLCQRHCGALKRQGPAGGRCTQAPGWGTGHPGIGHCKLHGGNTSSHVANVEKELASRSVITFGLPREVDPQQALLEEVHRTAGHVAWLQAKIASLPTDADLKQLDKGERLERPAVWVEMYQAERKHQTRVAEAAIRCGIAERQVRLAEAQGAQLAGVLRGVLDAVFAALADAGLQLDVVLRVQREQVPEIVQRHLREVIDAPAIEST